MSHKDQHRKKKKQQQAKRVKQQRRRARAETRAAFERMRNDLIAAKKHVFWERLLGRDL